MREWWVLILGVAGSGGTLCEERARCWIFGMCCSVLQCVTVCCRVSLQHTRTLGDPFTDDSHAAKTAAATHCNTLQHTATYCNSVQHTRTFGDPFTNDSHAAKKAAVRCVAQWWFEVVAIDSEECAAAAGR